MYITIFVTIFCAFTKATAGTILMSHKATDSGVHMSVHHNEYLVFDDETKDFG